MCRQDSDLLPPLLPARKLNRPDGNMTLLLHLVHLLLLPLLLSALILDRTDNTTARDMWVTNRPLKVGHTLTITGFPKADADRFMVNIWSGNDIPFHMSVWSKSSSYNPGLVICNSQKMRAWGQEVRQGGFTLKYDELFKVTVTLTLEEFVVILSDGSEIHLPNRLGASEYKDFSFDEGVLIHSFEIN